MEFDETILIRLNSKDKLYYNKVSQELHIPLSKIIRLAMPFYLQHKLNRELVRELKEYGHQLYQEEINELKIKLLNSDKKDGDFLNKFTKAIMRSLMNNEKDTNYKILVGLNHPDKRTREKVKQVVQRLCPQRLKPCMTILKREKARINYQHKPDKIPILEKMPERPKIDVFNCESIPLFNQKGMMIIRMTRTELNLTDPKKLEKQGLYTKEMLKGNEQS